MKVVEDVRRLRLAQLVEEFGSYAALNERLGRKRIDSTLSQYANRSLDSKTQQPKVMGSSTARKLEQACGKPEGWMDTDPDMVPREAVSDQPASYAPAPPPQPLRPWPFKTEDYDRLMSLDSYWHGHVRIALLRAMDECETLATNGRTG